MVLSCFCFISVQPALSDLLLWLLLLYLFVVPTTQDTLICGSSSYQMSSDPSHPSSGGRGNAGGGGSLLSMPNSGTKYQFVRMNLLMRNVCDLVPEQLTPDTFPNRLLITRCEQCAKCPQKLADIQRMLSQISLDANILSLLVILTKDFDSAQSIGQLAPETTVKFVFLDDDNNLGSPSLCELVDSSDGNSLKDADSLKSFSKTSVLFVSISFIILMVISLAWLVFYYVQRFRYAHAKDRLQRRLFNAAKKALARIPTRPVKAGDKELNSDCPVCIDPYRQGDICRQLPCRHIFHKSCVDPWLLEHRTCPMCKSDILKAFGYHVCNGRRRAQFSAAVEEDGASGDHDVPRGDRLSLDANSTGSESANPFPVVTEVHDPFGFSPSASPQLIQLVHQSPRAIQIVPLTAVSILPTQQHQQHAHSALVHMSIERHSLDTTDSSYDDHQNEAVQQRHEQQKAMSDETIDQTKATAEALYTNNHQITKQSRPVTSVGTTTPGTPNGAGDDSSQSAAIVASPPNVGGSGNSAFSLFRAVTGRRHHIVNLVNARSRSFSQSQEAADAIHRGSAVRTTIPTSNSAIYGFGGMTDAIVYSMSTKKGGEVVEALPEGNGRETANSKESSNFEMSMSANLTRARTAPSEFRRKIVASAATHRTATTGGGHWWSQRVKTGKDSDRRVKVIGEQK